MDQVDQALLLFFCSSVAFMSGYGVRELISLRRRRQARRIRDARDRLLEEILAADMASLPPRGAEAPRSLL